MNVQFKSNLATYRLTISVEGRLAAPSAREHLRPLRRSRFPCAALAHSDETRLEAITTCPRPLGGSPTIYLSGSSEFDCC